MKTQVLDVFLQNQNFLFTAVVAPVSLLTAYLICFK